MWARGSVLLAVRVVDLQVLLAVDEPAAADAQERELLADGAFGVLVGRVELPRLVEGRDGAQAGRVGRDLHVVEAHAHVVVADEGVAAVCAHQRGGDVLPLVVGLKRVGVVGHVRFEVAAACGVGPLGERVGDILRHHPGLDDGRAAAVVLERLDEVCVGAVVGRQQAVAVALARAVPLARGEVLLEVVLAERAAVERVDGVAQQAQLRGRDAAQVRRRDERARANLLLDALRGFGERRRRRGRARARGRRRTRVDDRGPLLLTHVVEEGDDAQPADGDEEHDEQADDVAFPRAARGRGWRRLRRGRVARRLWRVSPRGGAVDDRRLFVLTRRRGRGLRRRRRRGVRGRDGDGARGRREEGLGRCLRRVGGARRRGGGRERGLYLARELRG